MRFDKDSSDCLRNYVVWRADLLQTREGLELSCAWDGAGDMMHCLETSSFFEILTTIELQVDFSSRRGSKLLCARRTP